MSLVRPPARADYAANLRAALKGRGLSCAEAARQLGTNERVVRRWRNGETEPRPEARHELASLLSLDVAWFYKARTRDELAAIGHGHFETIEAAA